MFKKLKFWHYAVLAFLFLSIYPAQAQTAERKFSIKGQIFDSKYLPPAICQCVHQGFEYWYNSR